MARIIGGIACSHTPTIGFAVDGRKQNDPVWAPMFEGFAPAKAWLAEKKPDAAVHHLQRPRDIVLLRPLLGLHPWHR